MEQAGLYTLESGALRVRACAGRGGKTVSIADRQTGEELLFQPPGGVWPALQPGMPFEKGEAAGFDDVFPSMGEPGKSGYWAAFPDHGVIWPQPMEARREGNTLALWREERDWRYQKSVELAGNTLRYAWTVENRGPRPMEFVWVCHCLWRLEEDMRLFYPEGQTAADVLTPEERETELITRPIQAGTSRKIYLRTPVREGCCGFVWPSHGLRVTLRYDAGMLPYLGVWMTNGGFRGDRNFAFEPATGYYDTLARARRSGTVRVLEHGEQARWTIAIEIAHDTDKREEEAKR